MSLLKNKKAVEALPLRYIIIALVAALVVGIALQFTGTLRGGIQSTAETLNETLTTKTTCELDEEAPTVGEYNLTNKADLRVTMTDACGVDAVTLYIKQGSSTKDTVYLELTSGTNKDGVWSGETNQTGTYDVLVWAQDKATTQNIDTKTIEDIEMD